MSRVFVAEQHRLGRKVVVKVLSPELAAGLSGGRFEREIRVAASLQQANIVPLLAAGDAEGLPYYTMPFVEGLSLRARLERDGALPLGDVVGILRDVARALAFAHERGVVHRDIKPENVLLSGEAAVVTDFGIAKALSDSRVGGVAGTLTQSGTSIGTPAYMAPEQATGDPNVDQRADFYAFGCLAYELLSGRTPFPGGSIHRIVTAHLTEAPRPVTELRADTPPALAALVARCLEKDPAHRPTAARELLEALDAWQTPAAPAPRAQPRRRAALLGFAAVAVALAGFLILGRKGGRSEGASLAILPFVAPEDTAQEYRAEGLSDEIQAAMRKLPGLEVVSRSGVARFRRRRDLDAREVGRALGVRYVVQGTFRAAGRRLKVSARLTRSSDNQDLWQDAFEQEASDAFTAEDAIRVRITAALQEHLGSGPAPAGGLTVARGTGDSLAWDLYQRGEYLLKRRGPGVGRAAELFEQAVARDPGFARAQAALSIALELLPNFVDTSFAAVHDHAVAAARSALRVDSTLAEARTALALAEMHAFHWAAADSAFQRALAADAGDPAAHMHYARFLIYSGRLNESVAELRRAKVLDPTSAVISGWLANNLLLAGFQREAIAEAERTLELDSMTVPAIHFAARVNLAAGNRARVTTLLDREPRIPPWMGIVAMLYGYMGEREKALRLARDIEQSPWRTYRHSAVAMAALGVGDTAKALDAFTLATDAGEFWPSAPALFEPILLDQLRGSPRFTALLRRIGLDERRFFTPTR